jgi:hypothetical protein
VSLYVSNGPGSLIAEVDSSCGRYYLSVAGVVVAMEGDPCRDGNIPEAVLPPIPEEELASATIGGRPVRELPRDVVRFFRGDNWTKEMLVWAADRINVEVHNVQDRKPAVGGGQP